jgi:hypothetical protein
MIYFVVEHKVFEASKLHKFKSDSHAKACLTKIDKRLKEEDNTLDWAELIPVHHTREEDFLQDVLYWDVPLYDDYTIPNIENM